jgi:CheY-like chemotaxis protein
VAVFAFLTDRRRLTAAIGLLLLFFVLSLCQTWRLGGFHSDLGGDPDEGAHAVTALMISDYFTKGLPQGGAPLAFAEHYYQTFPKVALGHYPPGYYLPAAAALTLWCDSRSLILLQCLLVAFLGLATFLIVSYAWAGQGRVMVSILTALTVILHGEVARVSVHVLADLMLILLVLTAAFCWMAWMEKPAWKKSLLFGFVAAAAILTKGSALGLAGIPVFSVLLTRRWKDLKTLSWWGAGIPVALFAAPWMLWSVRFTQEGFTGDSPAAFFIKAVGEYATMAPWFFGWPLLLGIAVVAVRALMGRVDAFRASLIATCLGMQGIAMVVPAGFSPRYLLPSLIPVLVLVVLEVPRWLHEVRAKVFASLLLIVTTALLWRDKTKDVHGFAKAIEAATAEGQRAWLVSSDGRGEGAMIAAAAFRTPDRIATTRCILRGSKEIADTDWVGSHYETKFANDAALLAHLDKAEVDVVFVDLSMPVDQQKPHETKLKQALATAPQVWEKLPDQPVTRLADAPPGTLEIYRRIRPTP